MSHGHSRHTCCGVTVVGNRPQRWRPPPSGVRRTSRPARSAGWRVTNPARQVETSRYAVAVAAISSVGLSSGPASETVVSTSIPPSTTEVHPMWYRRLAPSPLGSVASGTNVLRSSSAAGVLHLRPARGHEAAVVLNGAHARVADNGQCGNVPAQGGARRDVRRAPDHEAASSADFFAICSNCAESSPDAHLDLERAVAAATRTVLALST